MSSLTHLKDKVNNREIEVEQSVKSNQALTSKAINPVSEESGTTQENPFIVQGTGTNNNVEIVDTSPVGKQLEKQGNSIVYNQLIDYSYSWTTTSSGATAATTTFLADGTMRLDRYLATGSSIYTNICTNRNFIGGHKYLLLLDDVESSDDLTNSRLYISNLSWFVATWPNIKTKIFTAPSDITNKLVFVFEFYSGSGSYFQAKIKLIDLTKWFNGNIPQDILDNPEHFYWYSDDFSYNLGEIRNSNGRYLVCGKRNIYNPAETYNRVIPSREYYYYGNSATTITYYDENKNVLSTESVSSESMFTTPSNCVYINSSVTSDITISLYYATGENYNQYYPYEEPKVYDTGTEGLRRVNSVKDTKAPDGTITRRVGTRVYESGDENDSDVLTDETTTYYVLSTPTIEQETPFSENIEINDYGPMGWKDTNNNYVAIPQGVKIFYPDDYVLFMDSLVRYTNGSVNTLALKSDLNSKADKATYETKTIQTTDWTALSNSTPYTYFATVTATATISANTLVELINDNPVLFATYGFAIASVNGQDITIYSIGEPAGDVSLKIAIGG